jgi:hypothetical protein
LRVGGRALAGKRVEIDGRPRGYAPFEINLPVGSYKLVVRSTATNAIEYQATIRIGSHHARSAPLKIIR